MIEPSLRVPSVFNECLVLATICGRSLFQSQQYHLSKVYGDPVLETTEQRRWLDGLLTTRLQALFQFYPSPTETYDPLLLFANILGQATVIYCCKIAMELPAPPAADAWRWSSELSNYQRRALEASSAIVGLASTLRELPFSKVSCAFRMKPPLSAKHWFM